MASAITLGVGFPLVLYVKTGGFGSPEIFEEIVREFGYVGISVISFVGASSVVIPIPYTVFIILFGALLNPFFAAFSSGLGSALGEFVGYAMGYFGRTTIPEKYDVRIKSVLKLFECYGAVLIFLFALTLLPDDLLFIPLGLMRYDFLKAFFPCFLGKLLMSLVLAYFGHLLGGFLTSTYTETGWIGILTTTLLLAAIVYAMLAVEWEKYLLP